MTVYGIDLGTCYSCIARDDGAGSMAVELLGNNGMKFVPSIVYFHKETGEPLVGETAKRSMISKPECTKALVKREMDREFCEEEIIIAGRRRKISPVEASACILKHLFDGANRVEIGSGRSPVTQAVITIPAKFNEKQRARTKLAAQMAGIQVIGLLNEPTAAAYAYPSIPAGNTLLVFDLGGGTLDVSIVTYDKGKYKVIGTPAGDDHLGGVDWDERLIELAFQKVGRHPDKTNTKVWKDLMRRAEECKQALSQGPNVDFLDFFEGSSTEEVQIERSEFEAKCHDLLERCWAVVDKAIENARVQSPKTKIDFFLLVGGSSNMPMIREGIRARYGATYGKEKESDWLKIDRPETAIAIGAAKFAQLQLNSQARLEDKATHSYGLRIERDGETVIKNLVKASDPIVFSQVFKGLYMNEESDTITIEIYENDIVDDYARFDDKKQPIFTKVVSLHSKKQSGTPLDLRIDRDKDGLIRITLTCDTVSQSFDVNPPELLIDAETKKNIENSLSLMKTM